MAFQPVPNCAEAVIHVTINGTPAANILHFQYATEPDAGQMQALAETVGDWVVNDYLDTCGAGTVYVATQTKGLSHAVDVTGIHTTGAGTSGSAGFAEPSNVTKAFAFQSGLSGRNSRGRLFHVGLPNGALTDPNHVAQSWVDDVIDVINLLRVAVEAIDWAWVIVSRYLDNVKRTTAVTYPVDTVNVANLTTDSARGRLPKT